MGRVGYQSPPLPAASAALPAALFEFNRRPDLPAPGHRVPHALRLGQCGGDLLEKGGETSHQTLAGESSEIGRPILGGRLAARVRIARSSFELAGAGEAPLGVGMAGPPDDLSEAMVATPSGSVSGAIYDSVPAIPATRRLPSSGISAPIPKSSRVRGRRVRA
jgi:hypothetical protein